jgi:CRP-like cAMP-binding protein
VSTLVQHGIRNGLLAALPPQDYAQLAPGLFPVRLAQGQILHAAEDRIEAAYFLQSGAISIQVLLEEGSQVEVGAVGREGMVGLPLVFGTTSSGTQAVVQMPATALRIEAAAFRRAMDTAPALRPLLLRYAHALFAQVSQTAACNRRHAVARRLARWLLAAHDHAGQDHLPLTHDIMSQMLGVRRAGISVAAAALQRAGLIRYAHGRLTVHDRPGLEMAACECHAATRQAFARLLPPAGGAANPCPGQADSGEPGSSRPERGACPDR